MGVPSDRWTKTELRCALLWRLARRHGWADWIPAADLVGAVPTHERGRAREVATDLQRSPLTEYRHGYGFKLVHARIDQLAEFLRDECGYSRFRIEATLSHFGGSD
jgi:hypothetical protein